MMSASLQKQEENQSDMGRKEKEESVFDIVLFEAAITKNWREVVKEYKNNPSACETKLTKSKQTALHIAVSSYNTDIKGSATDLQGIKEIVDAIPEGKAMNALRLEDANGNTPLHLAARHGSVSVCEKIALGRWELIALRNKDNETPLFLAAHRGKLDAFFCLRKIYKKMLGPDGKGQAREGEKQQEEQLEADIYSFCRAKDGKTVLHSAISGENYITGLAYQIIQYYPELVHSKNVDSESPLHVLARKPNSFRSSSHLKFYDSIIYQYVYVPELEEERCDDYTHESRSGRYLGNYETCVGLYELLRSVIRRFFGSISKGCRRPRGTDEENAENLEELPTVVKLSKDDEDRYARFPANYATFIRSSKFMIMFLLIFFRIGNSLAVSTNELLSIICKCAKMKENNDEEEIDLGVAPILIAAKMGIAEMVERIMNKIPIAIQDLDGNEKNVLLLAVERKQSKVLDVLLERKLPDFVFEQVDIDGNGPHHLAAMYRPNITWHQPGAALQMHGEVAWFRHVKKSLPPLRFPHRNKKGLTPEKIFREEHTKLAEDGTAWLIKTAESSSVIAALVATVAFATSLTVPGGVDNDGYPVHRNHPAFVVFTISSLIALWFSLSALVFFLAIITSRCEVRDFRRDLPGKLLMGLSSLFTAIAVMLVSFCAAHFFLLKRNLKDAAMFIYAVALVAAVILGFAQLPLYVDLMHASLARVPTPAIN